MSVVPELPTVLKSHLMEIEEISLESMAWEEDSILFAHLKQLAELEKSKRSSFVKLKAMKVFLTKVLHLAAVRLSLLCDGLAIPAYYANKIWTTFVFAISERTFVFKNQHIDSIMICAIYGVCKLQSVKTDESLSGRSPIINFNTIIRCYKQQVNKRAI